MPPQAVGISLLLCAVSVESAAQLCLKIGAAGGLNAVGRPTRNALLSSPAFWTASGVGLFAFQIILWTLVLHRLDVSVAFPMGSLCFVGVALLSRTFLGEKVDPTRWLGVLCILAGTALMTL